MGYITELQQTVMDGDLQKVYRLLQPGAADKRGLVSSSLINNRDASGRTPLYCAATNSDLEVCKLLVEYNANPEIPNRNGWTPLMVAKEEKKYAICTLLERASAGIDDFDENNAFLEPQYLDVRPTAPHVGGFLPEDDDDVVQEDWRSLLDDSKWGANKGGKGATGGASSGKGGRGAAKPRREYYQLDDYGKILQVILGG